MLMMIEKSKCKYLKEHSYYNHNLYKLPFQIDVCDCIQEVYDESWNSIVYTFGYIKNDKFVSCFQVDSECNETMCRHMIAFNILIAT